MKEENVFKDELKRDLNDVEINISYYSEKTDERLNQLDEIDNKLSELLDNVLVEYFAVEHDEVATMNSVDEKLNYIRENSWKLKPPAAGKLKEKIFFFGKEKKENEMNIRTDLEQLLKLEADAIKDNSEILKECKDKLIKDEEIVNELSAQIKQYEAEINAINDEILVLKEELNTKKELIQKIEEEIEKLQQKEEEQNDIIADKQNEIDKIKEQKEQELLEKNSYVAEKNQKEKELKELRRQLTESKRKDKDGTGDFTEIETQISEIDNEILKYDLKIKDSNTKISGFENSIRNISDQKNNAFKEKSRINENIKKKEVLLNNTRNEYNKSVGIITEKEKQKKEVLGKKAYNEEKEKKYNIEERKKQYDDMLKKSVEFSKSIDKNNERINKKFNDKKISAPVNNINSYAQNNQNIQNASDSVSFGNIAGSSKYDSEEVSKMTSEQLAKNFVNDVVNNSNSPTKLRRQLDGYGFQTYVNALPFLCNADRKNVLNIISERASELPYFDSDMRKKVDKLLGEGTSKLLFNGGVIRNINDLNPYELRLLRSSIDKYNNDILSFSNDDIKFLDENFMKALSYSSLIAQYSDNSMKKFISKFGSRNKQISLLKKEVVSAMSEYNDNKDKRFETRLKRGNEFSELLGRYTEVNPAKAVRGISPEILSNKSDLQKQAQDLSK